VRQAWEGGERDAARLLGEAGAVLERERGFAPDYLVLVDPESLQPLEGDVARCAVLLAGRVGNVRLLDNVLLE
jgi:pantothenate synthetase